MRDKARFFGCIILIIMVGLNGCASATGSYGSFSAQNEPLFGDKAKYTFEYEGPDRHPVIGIPGIFGSRLINKDTGEVVWGKFTGLEAITSFSSERIRQLSLPMEKGKSFLELGDDVVPDGPLGTVQVRLLGMTMDVNAYNELGKILQFGGFIWEGSPEIENRSYATGFAFGYDFRRDLVYNARKLDAYIKEKKKYMQEQYEKHHGVKDYDVRFDIVAHSMGGLLTRYYLRYGTQDLPEDGSLPKLTWEGAKHIAKVIIVGTPNAGYLDSFKELRGGLVFAPGAPEIPPATLGTFLTLYQMLPQAPGSLVDAKDNETPLDIFDPELWLDMEWGLANPKNDDVLKTIIPDVETAEERRAIAIDHLKKSLKRAKQFTEALAVDATPPQGTELHLFAGNSVWTNAVASVDKKNGRVEVINQQPGDGKVAMASAVFDRRAGGKWQTYVNSPIHWKDITFLFAAHMGITSDPVFAMNMLYILLGEEPIERKKGLFSF